jgi:excisionase family DNA binding protein
VERLNERGSSVSGERSVLTVKEVAEFLGISKSTCYDLIRRGEIKSISIGKSKRVLRAELLRWLESIQE